MKPALPLQRLFYGICALMMSFFISPAVSAQSCGANDIGFNSNTAGNSVTICSGVAGTTINGGTPAGGATYQWQVSNAPGGTYNNVSPDPGSVADWTIDAAYYNNAATYYFRRVVSGNGSGCNGNSDVVVLTVKFTPVVTNSGSISAGCANTGSILLYGSGGVTAYTYSLDGITYQAGNSFTSLAAGSYTGYVLDAIGCTGTKAITVTAAAAVSVTASSMQTSNCNNDGSIQLFAAGGIGPFTYSLDDVTYQSGNTFSALTDGTYTGWIQDSKGCKGSLAGIVVTRAAAVTASGVGANSGSCGNTGSIQLYAGGGTPGYTYSINNITYQPGSLFNSLAPGTYTGWVKDTKGCTASTASIVIGTTAGSPITVTGTTHSASSCANNGSIQVFRTGGVGPFSYSIDDVTYQLSNTLGGLAPGTYTAWVKDATGCKGSLAGIVVTQSSAVSAVQQHTNTSSCTFNGSITLNGVNGVPGYTYSLDDITYQAGRAFSGLAAGNYTGWVKDASGCKASVPVTIGTNTIVVTTYVTNASACGGTNGRIQLFRTGGTGPYTYSINGITYQSSNSFTGLTPAAYTGYVKDSYGCVGTLLVNVGPQSSTISLSSAPGSNVQAACSNAAITPITYAIGGGGTGATVTGLPAGVTGSYSAGVFTISGTATATGTFNYTVSTTGTCSQVTATGTITAGTAPTATFVKTQVSSCGGGADGTITVTAAGGTPPYTYSWTGPGGFTATTAALTGLGIGDYTVIVSDAGTCSVTIPNITMLQVNPPAMTFTGTISGYCSPSGSITLFGNNGVGPYTYSINGATYQSGNSFTNVAAGIYTGYVKDLRGCIGTRTGIVVGSSIPIVVTASSTNASNCAASNGTIRLFFVGGIPPYTYSIDGGTYQSSPVFSGLPAGTYTGYVKDSKVCIGIKTNITVGPNCPTPPLPAAGKLPVSTDNAKQAITAATVSVYPNPSATAFVLTLPGAGNDKAVITVKDITGRKMSEAIANGKTFVFGKDLKAGVYLVQIVQAGRQQSIKVIKE